MSSGGPAAGDVLQRMLRVRIRVRPHVRWLRHEYRGQPWYVIEDPVSARSHRVTPQAKVVLDTLDGARTLGEVLALAKQSQGDEAPTPQELISLVATLYRADLVTSDARPDLEELAARGARHRGMQLKQYFANPLSLRFPLIDPDRMLQRLAALVAPVPVAVWVAAWVVAVVIGALIAAQNWDVLTHGVVDRVFSTENLILLWFVYPVVKLLHEIGHGVVIRRLGGQVHEMGVMLLVLMPVPYVEASAAAAFPEKRARMLVGAAGVLTELFLAGLAMIIWAAVEPGLVRSICFNVALIAGVSTLLFNGNPLMRFDGYYVFADWVEIPNLAQRSTGYLAYVVRRFMFGMRDTPSPAASRGEAAWLLVYGVASFFYRISISFSIILLVASKYFFAGVLLAIWGLGNMIVRPILASAWFLAESPVLAGHRQRAVGATVAALTMIGVFLFLVPAPQWTRAEGVVWVPEQAQMRASAGCWVREVLAKSGERVEKGKALIVCEDPELATSVRVLEAQLLELRARDTAYFVGSRLNFDIVREEIVTTEAKLTEARRKLDGLQMQSPATGVFIMEGVADAPGRFAKRGELLAYVLEDGAATVRAVVEQDDVDLVRGATRSVAVRVADRIPEVYTATVQREVPGGTDRLPSAALAVTGGGEFGIDPRGIANDPDGVERPRVLVPVFQFDLAVDPAVRLSALGMRVYVRFQHTPAPVGVQAYRAARRLLLRRFEV